MNVSNREDEIKKVRQFIWKERLLLFPIKLLAAYFIYSNFEHGLLFIIAYILFFLGEQSARHFVSTQELNATIQNSHEALVAMHLNDKQTPSDKLK